MCKKLIILPCLMLGIIALTPGDAFGLTLDIRLTNGDDDALERHSCRNVDIANTDLEMPYGGDGSDNTTDPTLVCLRYAVPIPKGTTITTAYVEFVCDETRGGSRPVNLLIEGQLAVDAPRFLSTLGNLTRRAPWSRGKVKWSVENWTQIGQKSRTPNIAVILQEIIDQKNWASGNAIVLAFRDDPANPSTGLRCAESAEGSPAAAPLLHIEGAVDKAT